MTIKSGTEALTLVDEFIAQNMQDLLDNYGGKCVQTKKENNIVGIKLDASSENIYGINDEFKNTAYIHIKRLIIKQIATLEFNIAEIEFVLHTSIHRAGQSSITFDNCIEAHKRLVKKFKDTTIVSAEGEKDFYETSVIRIQIPIYPICSNATTPTTSPC